MTVEPDTSVEACERLASTFEAEAQHFNRQVNIDAANGVAAFIRTLRAKLTAAEATISDHGRQWPIDMSIATAAARNDALREAAWKATSFLVGAPMAGVPLHSPSPHEIADAILALIEQPAAPERTP